MRGFLQSLQSVWRRLFKRPLPERAVRGQFGEDLAVAFLKRQGFSVVVRNARVGGGELDIVARDGGCLVFVEVRARREGALVSGYHSLTRRKRAAFRAAVRGYLRALPIPCKTYRCDVVEVVLADNGKDHVCRHFSGVRL